MTLKGNLRALSLVNLIQINCTEQNRARLQIRNHAQVGELYFDAGEIVHATLGTRTGEEVVYELLTWQDGEFEMEMDVQPPVRTVTTPWSNLLLDGMRVLDEEAAQLETSFEEEPTMARINDLLKEMAAEIPGFIATDVVGMDGVSIAGYSVNPSFDAEAASAQFALVMKLVQKTANTLKAGEVEDNLVTTDSAYILTRFLGDGSYYLGVAVDKANASLGNLRMMTRQYADALWNAIPKVKR